MVGDDERDLWLRVELVQVLGRVDVTPPSVRRNVVLVLTIARYLTVLSYDGSGNRRLTGKDPIQRRATPRRISVAVIMRDELRRGVEGAQAREARQRLGGHQDVLLGRLRDTAKSVS